MAELEKAFFRFENDSPSEKMEFMFNPEKIVLTRSNDYSSGADDGTPRGTPLHVFQKHKASTLKFELILDTTKTGEPVTNFTNKLLAKMDKVENLPEDGGKLGNNRPPVVTFHWGQVYSFPAVITSATVSFNYFSSSGIPLRASVSLELTQAQSSDAFTKQNPTSGTPHPHRVHRVQRGETLDRISARYYGDSTRWRLLASANAIEDPLGLRPGALISVPDLDA